MLAGELRVTLERKGYGGPSYAAAEALGLELGELVDMLNPSMGVYIPPEVAKKAESLPDRHGR